MIWIGIIGCNYGRLVHLPAFRLDSRCSVIALAGSDVTRTAAIAQASNIPVAFGNWMELVEHPDIDAVTIGAPPGLQPAIAIRALELGKPVFAEKPIAADLAGAEAMVGAALASGRANMVDFNFSASRSGERRRNCWIKARSAACAMSPLTGTSKTTPPGCGPRTGSRIRRTGVARWETSSATASIIWNGCAAQLRDCQRVCPACLMSRPWKPTQPSA